MSEEDKDKTNIDNKEEEIKGEENQSQGESSPPDAQPSESSGSPSENNENQEDETYIAIREAIPKLSEDYRNIIILRDIQELSYDEISNITKLALGTVKSRINRARLKLRDIIKENRR